MSAMKKWEDMTPEEQKEYRKKVDSNKNLHIYGPREIYISQMLGEEESEETEMSEKKKDGKIPPKP